MKTINMEYSEYRADLAKAARNGIEEAAKTIVAAAKLPDDGTRFDYLMTELDEVGIKLAKSLGYKEPK